MLTHPALPSFSVTPKGDPIIRDHTGKTLQQYIGFAYDHFLDVFVWIDLVQKMVAFLVSDTLENAGEEILYLQSKFR